MEPLLLAKRERRKLASQYAELCLTCGTCAGGCPVTGVDGLDVRKVVRLLSWVSTKRSSIPSSPGCARCVAVVNTHAR